MQLIISKASNYNNNYKVFFSKAELQIILQTYSKQVSSGVAGIIQLIIVNKSYFFFFRSTFDKPIFQIEKNNKK